MFQALDYKGRSFLDILDDDLNIIEPLYFKEGSWLKYFSHSNILYTRATRAFVNYASIGGYIPHEYKRFNNYWNPRRDMLSHFILFLEFNNKAFLLQLKDLGVDQ